MFNCWISLILLLIVSTLGIHKLGSWMSLLYSSLLLYNWEHVQEVSRLVNSRSKLWSLFPKYFCSSFSGCSAKNAPPESLQQEWENMFGMNFSFSRNVVFFWTAESKRGSREITLSRVLPTPSSWATRSLQNWNTCNCVLQALLVFFLNSLFSPDGSSTLFGRNKLTSEHQDYLRLS